MRKPTSLLAILAALALAPAPAPAMDDSPPAMSPDHQAGKKAIDAKDWNAALKSLSAAERSDPRNADVQNLLGYAYRNSGKLDLAFKHYERALQLNPKHLGAHEYIGEAYLMANNLPKAEEHLASLNKLCFFSCSEYTALKKAVETYKATHQVQN